MAHDKPKPSVVIQLLDLVWANANKATSHSYERLNQAMRSALSLAIGSGMKFEPDDLKHVGVNYRSGHWIGSSFEWIYTEAVAVGNTSAARAFEAWVAREPYLASGVEILLDSPYIHTSLPTRAKERLCVDAVFVWEGKRVKVTSFGRDCVVACGYAKSHCQGKPTSRHKITHEDLAASLAKAKKAKPTSGAKHGTNHG